ncbi:putative ser thr protein phosphatase superfamily protein, partial [Botrytis fragariae]
MKSQLPPEANAYNFPVHLAVYYPSCPQAYCFNAQAEAPVDDLPVQAVEQSAPNFQILSDLHLEVCSQYYTFSIAPVAPYLILAGDIGRLIDYEGYLAFLAKQTAQFEKVFLVLG